MTSQAPDDSQFIYKITAGVAVASRRADRFTKKGAQTVSKRTKTEARRIALELLDEALGLRGLPKSSFVRTKLS